MNRIPLVVGHRGMVGRAFGERFGALGREFEGLDIPEIDIADAASVRERVTRRHDPVINCAAYTDVDGAESAEDEATRINGEGVRILAARCREIGATLIHYSTDYVFDGRADRPYPVCAPHDPLNAYGRSKAEGERALFESGADYLLVRTSWVYAPWGKNFVRTIARLASERPQLKVIDDQRGRPTSAEHLARVTLALLEKGARGVFHGTDGGECTWFEFAREIVRQTGAACEVTPCTTAEYPTPAVRPRYSVLDLTETEKLLGPLPSWQENLRDVLVRLEAG